MGIGLDPDSIKSLPHKSAHALFQVEQLLFHLQTAAIAGERVVAAHYAVAGQDDADGIAAVGIGQGTHRLGHAQTAGLLAVAQRAPVGYIGQRAPHHALKVGADEHERHTEGLAAALEILVELAGGHIEHIAHAVLDRGFQMACHTAQVQLRALTLAPVAQAQTTLVAVESHPPKRTLIISAYDGCFHGKWGVRWWHRLVASCCVNANV